MSLLKRTLHYSNLHRAWQEVAENEGVGGVDNISIKKWRRNWEERLINLQFAVGSNQYKASPLRIRRIPKPRSSEKRALQIPTITDRVLQRAVLQVLYPILDPRFCESSFGYRPGIGLIDAIRHITRLRKKGNEWVLDADIDDFFNSVDHTLLLQFLDRDLPDNSLLPLIEQWLSIIKSPTRTATGIPLGSPLSPMLANIYLHRLDHTLNSAQLPFSRYADDFIVLAPTEKTIQKSAKIVKKALHKLKLQYEPSKTNITSFEQGFDFLGVHFEQGYYWYNHEDKRIEVHTEHDWLFNQYGPDYE